MTPRQRRGTDPRTLLIDRLADWSISVGGFLIVAAVLGIFVFIAATILPLFKGAKAGLEPGLSAFPAPQALRLAFNDEHREKAVLIHADGTYRILDQATAMTGPVQPLPGFSGKAAITSAQLSLQQFKIALGTNDGRVWLGQAGFRTEFNAGERSQHPFFEPGSMLRLDPQGLAVVSVARAGSEEMLVAGISTDGRVLAMAGGRQVSLQLPSAVGRPASLLLHESADRVLVGTQAGKLLAYSIKDGEAGLEQEIEVFEGESLSSLVYAFGQQSVICGGSKGSLVTYSLVERGESSTYLAIHSFESMPSGITTLAASPRDKGFAALDAGGHVRVYFLTSERSLATLQLPPKTGGQLLVLTPKVDGWLASDSSGGLHRAWLDNPHPETTFKTLFGKVWYEGYERPDHVWQSTGGSDDFEQKFSLTPLIYGTLKGTFYALLFAVPLAVLAALYSSQFMSRRLRALVKPAIELMAAVPSVVMGFIAALILAPFIEKHLFTLLLGLFLTPLIALATLWAWRSAPAHLSRNLSEESEILVLTLGLMAGLCVLAALGPYVEQAVFFDLKVWLRNHFNVTYDQRNSLVVGFAMGFAVIPIIYTICEDALSAVPRHLVSASLSCGATPWQTAVRVVLPVALSGIFSAVMVGFGRAVGETMIVLMATGNTPVMDMSAFNGFRALSANIAVEIPEAPVDSTLYRVLFLAAMLLFLMTFAVNSVAEVIRLHLRRKYSQL